MPGDGASSVGEIPHGHVAYHCRTAYCLHRDIQAQCSLERERLSSQVQTSGKGSAESLSAWLRYAASDVVRVDRGWQGAVTEVGASQDLLSGPVPVADRASYHVAKRVIDLILASVALLLLAPVFLAIAIAIKLDNPGPVIFAQQRLGGRRVRRAGEHVWLVRPFTLYKFRSMEVNADVDLHRRYMTAYLTGDQSRLSELRPGRRPGDSYRPIRDARVTRVGAFLRKFSLDELPQLWNVVRGDMSLVGPRPPVPYEVELYEERHLGRLLSLPGVTGWAQVMGRAAIGFEDMARLDTEYNSRRSIGFDLRVLLLTIPMVLSRRGAD
jgi:lipopolysaccharide/colanic/teichoic acid biosynthesis glycosyltransferase